MRAVLRCALVLAVAAVAIGQSAPIAGGQESPVVLLGQDRVAPDDQLQVQGAGWPAGELATLELCGNNALDASADCDNRGSVSFAVRENGQFFGVLPVRIPPRACPCVVRVTTPGGTERLTPIEFPSAGFLTAEERVGDPTLARSVVIEELHIEGNGGWAQWFGAPTSREIVLVLQNRGDVGMRDVATVVRFGAGSAPTDVVDTVTVDQLLPGERVEFRLPVDVEALTVGARTATATVTGIGEDAVAATRVSIHPWALYALAALLVQLTLLRLRNRTRSWLGRRVEREQDDELLEIGPGETVVDLTEPRQLVTAGAPPVTVEDAVVAPHAETPTVVPMTAVPADVPIDALHGPPAPVVEVVELEVDEEPAADDAPLPVEADAEDATVIDLRAEADEVDEPDGDSTESDAVVDTDHILRSAAALTAAIRRDTDAAIDAQRASADAVVDEAAASIETEADDVRRAIAGEHERAVADAHAATERLQALQAEAEQTVDELRTRAELDRERAAYVLARAEREADDVVASAKERIALMHQDLTEVHDGIVATGSELRDRLAELIAAADAASLPDLADVDERIGALVDRFEGVVDEARHRLDAEQTDLRARARVASVEAVTRAAARAATMANDAIDAIDGVDAADSARGGDDDLDAFVLDAINHAVHRSLDPEDASA